MKKLLPVVFMFIFLLFNSVYSEYHWTSLTEGCSDVYKSFCGIDENTIMIGIDRIVKKMHLNNDGSVDSREISLKFYPDEIHTGEAGNIFIRSGSKFYKSTDKGESWNGFNSRLDYSLSTRFVILNNGGLAAGTPKGLFICGPDAAGWTSPAKFKDKEIKYLNINGKGELFVQTDDSTICKSSDGGMNWADITFKADNRDLTLKAVGNEYLYAVFVEAHYSEDSKLFIYRSGLDNINWQKICQIEPSALTSDITIETNSRGDLYLMFTSYFSEKGFFLSKDHGASWTRLNDVISNLNRDLSIDRYDNVFVRNYNGSLAYSGDMGRNWYILNGCLFPAFNDNYEQKGFNGFLETDDNTIYLGGNGLYRKGKNSGLWQLCNIPMKYNGRIFSITEDISGYIYVTTDDDLYYSNDKGKNWIKINIDFKPYLVSGGSYNSAYITQWDGTGFFFINKEGKSPVQYQCPGRIKAITTDRDRLPYIVTEDRVYYSYNYGQSWQEDDQGLDVNTIYDISYSRDTKELYCVTSEGIFMKWGSSWTLQGKNNPDMKYISARKIGTNGKDVVLISDGGVFLYDYTKSSTPKEAWINISGDLSFDYKEYFHGDKITDIAITKDRKVIFSYFDDVEVCQLPKPVGVEEDFDSPTGRELSIYPDPAENYIGISTPVNTGNSRIIISDIMGRQVFRAENPGTGKIDISGLVRGSYYVKIISGGRVYHGHFIKK